MSYNTTNAKIILRDFLGRGYTEAGAFGLLANIFCESRFNPKNMQDSYEAKLGMNDETYTASIDNGAYSPEQFAHDACGYGLAQWTYWSRKSMLYAYCKEAGDSIGSLTAQLEFMAREIRLNYKGVYNVLVSATDRAEACKYVMLNYERPADMSASAQKNRVGYCNALYEDLAEKDTRMNVDDFIDKLYLALKSKTLYVSGCFGAPMNNTNKDRYSKSNAYNMAHAENILRATADTFGFDCVCLIKGILWGWNADVNKTYGGAVYASNGVPDISDSQIIKECKNVSTDFSTIQKGELLWMSGHVGIYVGDGKAIECTAKWENKVQETYVTNLGYHSGKCRTWVKHGFLPYINYSNETVTQPAQPAFTEKVLKRGSTGEDVATLIELLSAKGYRCGDFGANVERAVREYQKNNGLQVDGCVGSETWGSLLSE